MLLVSVSGKLLIMWPAHVKRHEPVMTPEIGQGLIVLVLLVLTAYCGLKSH